MWFIDIRIRRTLDLFGDMHTNSLPFLFYGGARGVVVIVVRNGHGDTSSNPGRDWLHFIKH